MKSKSIPYATPAGRQFRRELTTMYSMSNYGITATEPGPLSNTYSSIWSQLGDSREFREEFNSLQLKRGVSFQIRSMLKRRGWTQKQLASRSKVTQGVVSRAQNPGYRNLTLKTLNRIAAGFDVAFIGTFVPFSELVNWFQNLSEDCGNVESFEAEEKKIPAKKSGRSGFRRQRLKKTAKSAVNYETQTPSGRPKQILMEFMQAPVISFPRMTCPPKTVPV
jgi:transcriptional regulator with XRE-family HTH domain